MLKVFIRFIKSNKTFENKFSISLYWIGLFDIQKGNGYCCEAENHTYTKILILMIFICKN